MSKFGGEYKFPDELEDDKAQEVDIKIEDDEVESKIIVQCRCGWQSARVDNMQEAATAWNTIMAPGGQNVPT